MTSAQPAALQPRYLLDKDAAAGEIDAWKSCKIQPSLWEQTVNKTAGVCVCEFFRLSATGLFRRFIHFASEKWI